MNQDHARIRLLTQKWDEKDTARDDQEQKEKQLFLEETATQIFSTIEDYLRRIDKVLRVAGGSVEIDAKWEHLGDQRLRRLAKGTANDSQQSLPIDLTIQGVTILYRGTPHRFSNGVEALNQNRSSPGSAGEAAKV
jgi:hypothetical protein